MFDRLDRLPDPQRDALMVAFGAAVWQRAESLDLLLDGLALTAMASGCAAYTVASTPADSCARHTGC